MWEAQRRNDRHRQGSQKFTPHSWRPTTSDTMAAERRGSTLSQTLPQMQGGRRIEWTKEDSGEMNMEGKGEVSLCLPHYKQEMQATPTQRRERDTKRETECGNWQRPKGQVRRLIGTYDEDDLCHFIQLRNVNYDIGRSVYLTYKSRVLANITITTTTAQFTFALVSSITSLFVHPTQPHNDSSTSLRF